MNVSNLELILVQKISNSTSTLDTLIYSKALQELKTGTVTVVNTTADLPNPNTAFVGHLFYEKTTEAMYLVDALGYSRKLEAGTNFYTWGCNALGQLGNGNTNGCTSPASVAGAGSNWCSISAGCGFSTGVKTDGTLWTWGNNTCGILGDGTTNSRSSPGTTFGCGTNWCLVSAGYNHTLALQKDGILWAWGCGASNQLGNGSLTNRSEPSLVIGGHTWKTAKAGGAWSLAIKSDGSLWEWGGSRGATGCCPLTVFGGGFNWCDIDVTRSTAGSTLVSAGGIKTDGTLWTWGYNNNGQLGNGSTTCRSSPGTVAGGGTNWCQVASGAGFMAAIKTDGTLWTWGRNSNGQLGIGTSGAGVDRSSPGTTVGGGTNWCLVSAGYNEAVAVKTDGTLWRWGYTSGAPLGGPVSSPVTVVGGLTNWYKVSVNRNHALGIKYSQ